jgi:hypothetical protein
LLFYPPALLFELILPALLCCLAALLRHLAMLLFSLVYARTLLFYTSALLFYHPQSLLSSRFPQELISTDRSVPQLELLKQKT